MQAQSPSRYLNFLSFLLIFSLLTLTIDFSSICIPYNSSFFTFPFLCYAPSFLFPLPSNQSSQPSLFPVSSSSSPLLCLLSSLPHSLYSLISLSSLSCISLPLPSTTLLCHHPFSYVPSVLSFHPRAPFFVAFTLLPLPFSHRYKTL